jgi:tetratricopeptide (TPR) repeat protein
MEHLHLDCETLERFLADDLTPEEDRSLQRHVFTCARCEERLVGLLSLGGSALPGSFRAEEPAHREVIRTVVEEGRQSAGRLQEDLALERAEAASRWRDLERLGQEERRNLVWNDPRYQTWGFFELLADLCHDVLVQEPRKAEDVARLALDVAEQLSAVRYGAPAVEAAKARAWTHLANALRVLSDFRQAEQAFQTAELHLSRSWLDPLDEALLLEFRAPLRRAQGRFEEALEMLDTAIAIYREVNEPHLHGRVLLIKGVTFHYQGNLEAAAECYRHGLFLIDRMREPRLVVSARNNLVLVLHESGRSAEAALLLPEARQLVEREGKRPDLLRLEWVAGRVLTALGHWEEAEQAYTQVREGFAEEGLAFDAALASLDLAALLARLGRTAEVKRLAAEMLPVFQSREVHREALAAFLVFQQAAEREQLTLGLVEEVSSYLKKSRGNPQIRFRGGEDS